LRNGPGEELTISPGGKGCEKSCEAGGELKRRGGELHYLPCDGGGRLIAISFGGPRGEGGTGGKKGIPPPL